MINFSNMIFSGNNNWSEGVVVLWPLLNVADDDNTNDNLDLVVVPQYGRNANHTG